MSHTKYDELYNYLAAFQNSSLEEIALYLSGLGQKEFDCFAEGLASVMPEDKFDTSSRFNFSVDSTLNGGKFPCRDLYCREKNLARLARFAVQYSDKVLIKSPIEYAFSEHDDIVDITELAFGIYLTMRLEQAVKAGYVGFSDGYIPLCEKCLANQLKTEKETRESLRDVWSNLVDDFCQITTCVLVPYDDEGFYVAIHGMDAYGSHEEIDVDFIEEPQIYIDALAKRGSTKLSKEEIIQGGLSSLVFPVLLDCYSALVNPVIQDGSYLTTRSAQVKLLDRLRPATSTASKQPGGCFQINCSLPFAEDASLSSLIDFRRRNEESFLVFRDRISSSVFMGLSSEREANELRRDIIEPELHRIDLLLKNSQQRVITAAGAEALISAAGFAIGQYCGIDPAATVSIASALGAGNLGHQIFNFVTKDKIKDNPMYFLWQLEKKTGNT